MEERNTLLSSKYYEHSAPAFSPGWKVRFWDHCFKSPDSYPVDGNAPGKWSLVKTAHRDPLWKISKSKSKTGTFVRVNVELKYGCEKNIVFNTINSYLAPNVADLILVKCHLYF